MKIAFTVFTVLSLISTLATAQTFTDLGASLIPAWNSSAAWGDYDNDGDLDVVIAGYIDGSGTTSTNLYRNDDGVFVNSGMVFSGAGASALAWGDYDNDGDIDIIISGKVSGSNDSTLLYRNDQTFFTKINSSFFKVLSGTLAWGDYDNDGDLDLLIGGSDQSNLYRNDGGDSFTPTNAITETLANGTFTWGDYDKDGWLDFAMIGRITSNTFVARVYHNNQNGTFTDINAGLWGVRYSAAAWGDFDNDGDLDLAYAGNYNSLRDSTILYRNDNGLFTNSSIPFISLRQCSMDWGDYDNDGDLDLLVSGDSSATGAAGASHTLIYRNERGTHFTRIDYGLVKIRQGMARWGDFDNDGDLDILICGYISSSNYTSKIYKNNLMDDLSSLSVPVGTFVRQDTVTITWNRIHSIPDQSLSYNINIFWVDEDEYFVSPMANTNSGKRYVAGIGNCMLDTSKTYFNLEGGKYYWSLQTVNHAFQGSEFTSIDSFEIPYEPFFVKNKNQIDFGMTMIGSPVFDTITITNDGNVPLIIDTIYISDPLNFDFTHSVDTIPPGESRDVHLMFDPSEYGIHEDALVFIHNAQSSPDTVYLKGSVLFAKIAVSDTVLTGLVNENGTDSTAFKIYNQGMTGLTYAISESENAFTFLKKIRSHENQKPRHQNLSGPVSLEADLAESTESGTRFTEAFGDMTAYGFNLKTVPDQFVRFDLTEPGTIFLKGTVPQSFYAADFSTDGSVYYAVDDVSKQFGVIDTATGDFTVRGPLTGLTGYVTGMTVDPTDETIYLTVTDGSSAGFLYTVNPEDGTPSLIGTITNMAIPIAIGASPAGILYSYDITTDSLYVIDKATAFGSAVASLDFNATNAQGMDFDPTDGLCYLASYTSPNGYLRTVDLNTGITTIIGAFPNQEIDGFGILKTGLPWVYAQPTSGTILPGDSAEINVYWYGKIPAEIVVPMDGYFHIASDDTSSPNVSVSLHLDVAVSADENENQPVRYHLAQNFPNPFNPSTTIRYDIKKAGKVSLKIYNTLGQEVRTLVNGYRTAGNQTVIWDGKNNQGKSVSSGIYFYRLEAGSFVKTMKMLLVR